MFGYNGEILRVNLSNGHIEGEEQGENFYRRYLGGRALALYFLLREVPTGVDALAPENKVVFAASIITGAPIPGTARHSIAAKSPLTEGYGESEAGGHWGAELKRAGFDAIVVEGRSDRPCYLWIKDGKAEIRDASHLWGKDTGEVQELIRAELGDPKIRTSLIGPAGENMVRFSAVVNDLKHVNGRSGLGAVLGSKNLKGVAVRGTSELPLADGEACRNLAKDFSLRFKQNADNQQLKLYGTSQYFLNANAAGTLPTRNFSDGTFEEADKVGSPRMHEILVVGSEGCYACPIRCKRVCRAEEPYKIDPAYGGPEFESMTAMSSLCGVDDIHAMVKGNELCNRYGLDTIATGNVIAFAMECTEKGLLSKEQTDGIDLRFGNADGMVQMIEKIAHRDGFGNLLAEGVKRVSDAVGQGSEKFAMHVKGQEFPMHEPRGKFGVGLAYAVSPTGADHLQHEHDGAFDPVLTGYSHKADAPSFFSQQIRPLGVYEPVKSLYLGPEKVKLFTYLQHYWSLFNALGLCIFTFGPVRTFRIPQIVEIVNAITGWDTSLWELMKAGERGTTMARVFNIKHGLTREDDQLPERMFTPLGKGALNGSKLPREELSEALSLYYEMMGWDSKTGIPTAGKLAELDLYWAVSEMRGAVSGATREIAASKEK